MRFKLIVAFLLLSLVGNAQTFEEYAQQRNAEFNKFVSERDKEFAEFLRKRWEEFEVFKGVEPKTTPKPVVLPVYQRKTELQTLESMPFVRLSTVASVVDVPSLPIVKPQMVLESEVFVSCEFYGNLVKIPLSKEYVLPSYMPSMRNEGVAQFWEQMSATNYHSVLYGLFEYKEKFQLNDWGFYLLIKEVMGAQSADANIAILATWFFLKKSGYATKVSYSDRGNIGLLLPTVQQMYGISYYTFEGNRYYIISGDNDISSTYTYDDYEDGRILDLSIVFPLNFEGGEIFERKLSFDYGNENYNIKLEANQGAINFYNDYPYTSFDVYFNSSPSACFIKSISEQLENKILEMNFEEQCNFLIRLTQKSFSYKTDREQFGVKQRSLFPEETLFFPYSDCEDRAIFYAYLVKTLLKTKIVGVLYEGHMANAIKDEDGVFSGSYFNFEDGKYIVADPTFSGANVGVCMPAYCGEKAEIISIR